MGGDSEPYKIPDYRIYKVANVPELAQVERALAAQGLKDPWLRNEVWRFDRTQWGTPKQRWSLVFFRGFKYGFGAFIFTILGTALYDKINPNEQSHGHH